MIRNLAWADGTDGGQGRAGGGKLDRQVLPAEKRIPGVKIEGPSEVMDVVVSRKEG